MSAPRSADPERRAIVIEDIVNLVSLLALMLLMFSYGRLPAGPRNVLFGLLMVIVVVLLIRRKARIDRLFARMAEDHARTAGTLPLPPGVPTERLTGGEPRRRKSKAKRG